jgi:hypothetical protein
MAAEVENDTNETETSQMPEQTQPIQRLVGSTSLQVASIKDVFFLEFLFTLYIVLLGSK